MPLTHHYFATCAKGLEPLLAAELQSLGAKNVKDTRAGIACEGDLPLGLRVCLWSRLASRVLLRLAQFPAATPDQLYEGARWISWHDHLSPSQTLAVSCTLDQSAISHSHYAALKVKDAIVDSLRDRYGYRPSVATIRPDLPFHVHIRKEVATVYIDFSGESLHRRGYRAEGVEAPLKETLAAAIQIGRAHV